MPAGQGAAPNYWALLTRANPCRFATARHCIDSASVGEPLGRLAVVILDNARIHKSRMVQARRGSWQERGLFLFDLPPYPPHLNIAQGLWRKLEQ